MINFLQFVVQKYPENVVSIKKILLQENTDKGNAISSKNKFDVWAFYWEKQSLKISDCKNCLKEKRLHRVKLSSKNMIVLINERKYDSNEKLLL